MIPKPSQESRLIGKGEAIFAVLDDIYMTIAVAS